MHARWPAVRAGLITLAIAFALVDGCPIPERKYAPAWSHDLVDTGDELRRTLRKPVERLAKDLDITQRWNLFRGAGRKRFRMWLEGKAAQGEWQVLHRVGDSDYTEYEALLDYRRTRGTYNPSGQYARNQYRGFAQWMILRMLAEHPEFIIGRTRMERILIGEDGYTPLGEFTHEHQEIRRTR